MTPEEWQREYARLMRGGMNPMTPPVTMESQVQQAVSQPLQPGMVNQSIQQAGARQANQQGIDTLQRDISGQERGIEAQRAMAQAMRNRGMPQGKTVGKSGIYVAPNWAENLGGAASKLAGAYMGRQANKRDAALDKTRSALAKREEERKRLLQDRSFGLDVEAGLRDQARVDLAGKAEERAAETLDWEQNNAIIERADRERREAAAREHDLKIQENKQAFEKALAADKSAADIEATQKAWARDDFVYNRKLQDELDSSWTVESYLLDGKPFTVATNGKEVRAGTSQGDVVPADQMARATPFDGANPDAAGVAQSAAAQKAREDRLREGTGVLQDIQNTTRSMNQILRNDRLGDYVGKTNVNRFLSKWGIGKDAWEGQAVQTQLAARALDHIANYSNIFKPMSGQDVIEILKGTTSELQNPEAIATYFLNDGLNQVKKDYMEQRTLAESAGDTQLVEAYDAAWNKVETDLKASAHLAAASAGMDPEKAADWGFDPDEIRALQAMRARR